MGFFDSVKKTASNAVNAVKGNQTAPQQQPVQPVQPQQPVQQQPVQPVQAQQPVQQQPVQPVHPQQPVQQQPVQPVQLQQPVQQQPVQPVQPQQPVQQQPAQVPPPSQPQNSDPNTFFGKEYRGTGIGAGAICTSTWFHEDYLQFGNEKIPYSDLSEITILHMANRMTNGTASTYQKSKNKQLMLSFNIYVLGFEKGVDYANKKIAEASETTISRKFLLRNADAVKLEVFEEYISINRQGGNFASMMGTSDSTEIIMISQISDIHSDGTQIIINYKNDKNIATQSSFVFNPSDSNIINDIISYVKNYVPDTPDEIDEETWTLVSGSEREFTLLGRVLKVDENWDVFNSYRTMYMKCATLYAQQLKKNYMKKINNFDSFMKFYLPLYKEYLNKIINKTTDILVSAGIWTETSESIMQRHVKTYHLAMDDYTIMYNSMLATVRNNKSRVAAVTSFVPNLVGGGFGLKGAAVGIAEATAFNLLRDGAESAMIENMNISSAQKAELYGRINQKVLFDRAFLDMWRVFLTLIDIMNENGKNIWRPTSEDSVKADNIMKNVSNPNFPQDQFPNVMIQVIGMNPYKRSIYELLRSRDADEVEITAISEFFGYTDTTPDCVG